MNKYGDNLYFQNSDGKTSQTLEDSPNIHTDSDLIFIIYFKYIMAQTLPLSSHPENDYYVLGIMPGTLHM